MRRIRLLAAFLLAAALAPACVPVVTHSPWVEAGMGAGTVGAVATRPILEGEVRTGQSSVTPVLAPFTVFARYGWTPESAGTPVPISAGVSFPIALPFSVTHLEGDVYAQLTPAAGRTAAGAGVLLSRTYAAPYVQAGRALGGSARVYTTQGVAFFRGGGRAPDATVWMPAAALQADRFHLFVQAGLGRERLSADSTRGVRFLMAGAVAEMPSGFRLPRF